MKNKKFKLKQWYPSLPSLTKKGVIVDYYEVTDGYSDNSSGLKSTIELSREEVEDNPEFWEEVVEKDYQILSYTVYGDLKNKATLRKNGKYLNSSCEVGENGFEGASEKQVKEFWSKEHKIYSIKRLSDNEVFTVGDEIVFLAEKPHLNHTSSIKSFKIEQNTIYVSNPGCLIGSLKNIKHIKKPLFTTEDGVDIYIYDTCWVVSKEFNYQLANYKINNIDVFFIPSKNWYFSTKEAAQEYILKNKPCLSFNDIVSEIDLYYGDVKKLKNLIKSKL